MRMVAALLLTVFLSWSVAAQKDAATLVTDFDQTGIDGWWTYSDEVGSTFAMTLDGETVYDGTNALRMDISVVQSGFAGAGFDYGTPFDWTAGSGLTFFVRATKPGIPAFIVLHLGDETQTSEVSPGVTPFAAQFLTPDGSDSDWVNVVVPWSDFERLWWIGQEGMSEFVPQAVGSFEIAFQGLDDGTNDGTLWFDNIRVLSETDLNQPPTFEEQRGEVNPVRVNQLGYRPTDMKMVVAGVPFETFEVVDTASGEAVFTGEAELWGLDADSGEEVYRGYFDRLTEPGDYRVVVEGVGESYPFVVSDDPYTEALYLGLRALYLQRSGIDIDDEAISGLTLDAGHLSPALLWDDQNGEPVDISGGWYDAGDYGRFIPTGAFAVNQLLLAYEANPDAFTDGFLDIPESGNGVPDLLDEVRWELEWMLKMQREDGAVHHKVTTRSFPGYGTLAAEDDGQLFVFGISSADTAYFAAVTAQAAPNFAAVDPDFSARLLDAADRAWAWLEQHPEQVPPGGFQNPPVSDYPMQGGYSFVGVEDVPRMWAAAELLKAKGDARYRDAFAQLLPDVDGDHRMSWANSYPMALYAYLTSENTDEEVRERVEHTFAAQAQDIYDVAQGTGYGVALSDSVETYEYIWGSNQIALAHGLYLMLADELFDIPEYRTAAKAQIDYLFGVNPLARSYFGGLGANPILHPHHNLAYHFRLSIPGFVGEGPNSHGAGGDAVLIALQTAGAPPAQSYIDDWESWASNEPTIVTNATFVALMAYVNR